MIIIFHLLGFILYQVMRKRRKQIEKPKIEESNNTQDAETTFRFDPPLYKQRYSVVYETIIKKEFRDNVKKLVDLGCGEFSLFYFIKTLNLDEIFFVDIDEILLSKYLGVVSCHTEKRLLQRKTPLWISVFRGTAIEPDRRLQDTDAVTAIELIEHLYPDTLDALPYNIFSFIKPKLVIITTPNAEFNVVFDRLEGFRHPDHKFEWTRQQFQDWCNNIVQRFPGYSVEISGVGDPPDHLKNVGHCSQLAIFTKKNDYLAAAFSKSCRCTETGLCKGQTAQSKLLCDCVCALCLPDFSVGVCTYLSCNIDEEEAYRPMRTGLEKVHSDTMISSHKEPRGSNEINPSFNIYYKLISKIEYPYERDTRSDLEKIMEKLEYHMQYFSLRTSLFYNEDKDRCEVPIDQLLLGTDIAVAYEDIKAILVDAGYEIEKCTFEGTDIVSDCLILIPKKMDDYSGTSEVTEDYSSKSECNEKMEALSDWDEVVFSSKVPEQGATSSEEASTEGAKPLVDPLVDSGYQKSPSSLDTNKQLLPQDSLESVETDYFEDSANTPNLSSDDNKLHLKKTVAKEKFPISLMVPMTNSNKPKLLDPNKINELDRFHNMSTTKTFMSSFLKPQNEFRKSPFRDFSGAGSSTWKKRRMKEKDKKLASKKESEEPTALDDIKSVTNCIIENSLNKINVGDEDIEQQAELIQDLADDAFEGHAAVAEPEILVPLAPVENGDLVNNNRDNEGNNMEINNVDIDEGIDLLNDNVDEIVPVLADNVGAQNNNDNAEEEPEIAAGEQNEVDLIEPEAAMAVAQASREALFDINSDQDLLEDFDLPPQPNEDLQFSLVDLAPNNVVLVGVHPINSNQLPAAAPIETLMNSFPDWMLQILGSQVVLEEGNHAAGHDEPHFYCQGDGVGVHPSVIAVEVDEAEDADNDTSTEETSSNNTVDFAEIDPGPSDMLDMSSLPEESSLAISVTDDNTSGRRQDENLVNAHINSGTQLVNDLIHSAEDEVNRRSQINSFIDEPELSSLSPYPDPLSSSSEASEYLNSHLPYHSDNENFASAEESFSEEQELSSYPRNTTSQLNNGVSPIIAGGSSGQSSAQNGLENRLVNRQSRLQTDIVEEAESFNESEKSDYFDTKTEEF